ncbi:MAG: molybdenum cofactor biosynthesis protein B [Micropepsaceae bacterium]
MSASRIDETKPFLALRIAVLTVSDTRTRENDTSGDTLVERLTGAGHTLAERMLLRDDVVAIRNQLTKWVVSGEVDVIITTGGTGLTGRDVTVEAMRPLFEKEIDGFSVVFHQISYEKIGTSTMQSRACAGLARGTLMFALPGSTGAVKDGWDGILKWQLDARHKPCNFVELMPRFEEHLTAEKRKK